MSGWPFEPPISPMEARVRERLPEPPGWTSNPSGTAFAPLHGPVAHRPARDRAGRDEPFDASSFSKNRERLLAYDVARAFFAEVVAEARQRRLLSADHFTVDGTLLEAWASLKSYRPRDVPGNKRGTRGGPSPRSCSDTWCTPRSVPFGPAAARQRSARPARRRVDARGLTARAARGSRSAVAGSPAHPTRRPRRPRGGRPAPRMPSNRP